MPINRGSLSYLLIFLSSCFWKGVTHPVQVATIYLQAGWNDMTSTHGAVIRPWHGVQHATNLWWSVAGMLCPNVQMRPWPWSPTTDLQCECDALTQHIYICPLFCKKKLFSVSWMNGPNGWRKVLYQTSNAIEWYKLLQILEMLQFLQQLFYVRGGSWGVLHFLGGVKTPQSFLKRGREKATLRPLK